jgi:hypothetical protein
MRASLFLPNGLLQFFGPLSVACSFGRLEQVHLSLELFLVGVSPEVRVSHDARIVNADVFERILRLCPKRVCCTEAEASEHAHEQSEMDWNPFIKHGVLWYAYHCFIGSVLKPG